MLLQVATTKPLLAEVRCTLKGFLVHSRAELIMHVKSFAFCLSCFSGLASAI